MIHDGDRALLLRQLVALDRGGTPLAEAAQACGDAATRADVKRALTAVAARLTAGDPVADALGAGGFLSPHTCDLIGAGDNAGDALAAIARAARLLSLRHRVRRSMQSVLSYPMALLIGGGMIAVLGGLMLSGALDHVTALIHLQPVDSAWTPYLAIPLGAACVVGGIAGLVWLYRAGGAGRPAVLPVPFVAGHRYRALLADVLATCGAGMRSGLSPDQSLKAMAQAMYGADQLAVEEAAMIYAETGALTESLTRTELAHPAEAVDIELAETRDQPERLEQLADRLSVELERGAERFLRVAWPAMVIALGVLTYALIYWGTLRTTHGFLDMVG